MNGTEAVFSVSDFVAVFNQTLEFAYPSVGVVGELANFRVSKNRWVYFDLKDELSSVKFFGTVYQLPGPLEDGMMVQVMGMPRLHNLYGFSVNIQNLRPVGEGSIKKAASLLESKLSAEGLFDESRKRQLPYPPRRIGLVASDESAAYHDFMKILNARWGGIEIIHANVQVQGEASPRQVVAALDYLNVHENVDVIVITRGGGSAEDLAAFSTEQVTRAVAGSRIPTLVAIGHEVDVSLAELAADQRASTPSNAAELLVPDKVEIRRKLKDRHQSLASGLQRALDDAKRNCQSAADELQQVMSQLLRDEQQRLQLRSQLLEALNPDAALRRGYALVTRDGKTVRSVKGLQKGNVVTIRFHEGSADAAIRNITT